MCFDRQSQFCLVQQPSPQFVDYSTLPRQYSPAPQNYDIMWQTELRFGQPVYDPPVHSSYNQYGTAVSYPYNTYDSHQPNGYIGQCIDTDYVTGRPVPQCENYDERRWQGASNAVACSRLRESKHSRSFVRRPHHDDSCRFRRQRRRSGSTRRRSDASRSAAATDSRRRHVQHSESTYSTEASLHSLRRSRHTRHHRARQRRRYSSSSSGSRCLRSSTVSGSLCCV